MTVAVPVMAGTAAIIVLGFYAVVSHIDLADANPEAAETSFEQASSPWLKDLKGSTRSIPRTTLWHGHESTQRSGTDAWVVDCHE